MTSAGSVRLAIPGDLDRVAALWSVLGAHHRDIDPVFAERPGADEQRRQLAASELEDPDAALFVWEEVREEAPQDGANLLGMCCVRIDRAPAILAERERAEITDLVVRDDYRRRGIGRALVAEAMGWVAKRGLSRVEVRVATGNASGQAFWRGLEFADLMDVMQRRL